MYCTLCLVRYHEDFQILTEKSHLWVVLKKITRLRMSHQRSELCELAIQLHSPLPLSGELLSDTFPFRFPYWYIPAEIQHRILKLSPIPILIEITYGCIISLVHTHARATKIASTGWSPIVVRQWVKELFEYACLLWREVQAKLRIIENTWQPWSIYLACT